jgi:hypothetical protein
MPRMPQVTARDLVSFLKGRGGSSKIDSLVAT